ncbi:replication-relaxation family protein [Kribbella sp. NPDC058693]|uniref:replication-relaxation family protein n=1 Tax=Kribbella sp. NPDC058693 TaxID=3346602 RepID=UPI0036551026
MTEFNEDQRRPIARPVASSTNPHPRRSDRQDRPLTAGNTVSASGGDRPTPRPSIKRAGRRDLQAIRDGLLPRDVAILQSVSTHRFLTTRHIQSLYFHSHGSPLAATRSTNRVLSRLKNLRLIDHLERRVGGIRAGSASYIWQLASAGDRIVQLEAGNSVHRRLREPSLRLLDHTLAVADIHVALTEATQRNALELVTVDVEPGSWRQFLGLGGERRLLRPDLAVVTAQGEFEDHWFIEADLSTEHPPTVIRKCQLYEDYRASGVEQEARGIFPRILWVVPNQKRADKLTTAIQGSRLDQDLFRVITMRQLVDVVIGGAA